MRLRIFLIAIAVMTLVCTMAAQQQSTTCTFADGKGLRITYTPAPVGKELTRGVQWSPGNQPILLFTDGPTEIHGATLPIGAYRLFIVPDKQQWTLVVNRDVNPGATYNKADDVVRAPMPLETLPAKEITFEAYLGHVAPQQCSLRLDYGTTRATLQIDGK